MPLPNQTSTTNNQDGRPVVVDDHLDPPTLERADDNQQHSQTQDEPAERTEPTYYEDPRERIAAKMRAREEAERKAREAPPDEGDDDIDDENKGAVQRAAPSDSGVQQQQQQQPAPKTYRVKVNHNEFDMTHEALLAAAEIDASEADLYQPHHLVRLAQKQLAANELLEEAKASRKRAAVREPAANEDEEQPSPPQPPRDHHSLDSKDVIESFLFEDPAEAAPKFEQLIEARVERALAGRNKAQVIADTQREIVEGLSTLEQAHADLAQDRYARVAVQESVLDEIENELRSKGVLNEEALVAFRDRGLTARAYVAAIADGHQLRPPRAVMDQAVARAREELGRPAPQPHQGGQQQRQSQQQTNRPDRVEQKRGLFQQPQRSATPLPPQRQQPVNIDDHRRQAVRNFRQQQASRTR